MPHDEFRWRFVRGFQPRKSRTTTFAFSRGYSKTVIYFVSSVVVRKLYILVLHSQPEITFTFYDVEKTNPFYIHDKKKKKKRKVKKNKNIDKKRKKKNS